MKKFLVERFLPMWAKETVLRENRRLKGQNRLLRQENENLHAYIRGVQAGLRTARKAGGA
ncbi:MAG: hypothetical protein J6C41_03400 [Oscillospiraceae bacterium]|nr:hypothetical protein [Oscillospiraceae bacterium]